MRATTLIVAFLAMLGFSQQVEAQKKGLPRCNVGADPVNLFRQPTADEEVIASPTDKAVRVASGSGKVSYCILEAGTPIVVDRKTGEAMWVFGCGNPLHSRGWFPKRSPLAPVVAGIKGDRGDTGPAGRDGIDATATGGKGFWCFRGFGQGFTCTAALAVAVWGGHELLKDDPKPLGPKAITGPAFSLRF